MSRSLVFALGAMAGAQFFNLNTLAEGFRNPPAGAFSLARAGGRIAHVDDPSAIAHNPANIVDIKGPAVEFTPTIVYIKAEHQNAFTGQKAETRDPVKLLPNLFATMPIIEGKLAAGLGVTTPYGLSNEWRKEGAYAPGGILRYSAPWYTEMVTVNFNPSISFKPIEQLSLGAGLNVQYSELTFKQFYPWVAFPGAGMVPDGNIKAKGDGVGFGGNVGATWQVTERQRIAATYRSPMEIEYSGDFRIDNVPAGAAAFGAASKSSFDTEIEFPTIIALGYGLQVTDTIRLEIDGEWVQFSNFDKLDLGIGNNQFLLPSSSLPQNWDDTFTIGIGGDWQFAEEWTLRAGYQFYESPVPDATLSPTIPDANQHAWTTGLGYRQGNHRGEFAYGYIHYDDRNITSNLNPAFNGKYEVQVHLVSLAYTYTF
ncbi:MAG: OmpP1/FadL family transporter [Verrucomicrobiales bacterium]